jgi:hypothetical protein
MTLRAAVALVGVAAAVSVLAVSVMRQGRGDTEEVGLGAEPTARRVADVWVSPRPPTDELSTPSTAVDPSEPSPTTPTSGTPVTLPARPGAVRQDPAALAARFVAEWLTYPPGPEPAATLAARVGELVTSDYREVVHGLSTAGTQTRPGSLAVLGATSQLEGDPLGSGGVVIFRVTAWQALYGSSEELAGPYSWDVHVVDDGTGGWLVDGLRRAG